MCTYTMYRVEGCAPASLAASDAFSAVPPLVALLLLAMLASEAMV
jgi:hypothetical protein